MRAFGVDDALALVAVIQTIITTLRAGSRAVYLLREGTIGVMDGPLIHNNSSPLWEPTQLFRQCVTLGLLASSRSSSQSSCLALAARNQTSDNLQYQVHDVPLSRYSASSKSIVPYSLSPFGNRNTQSTDNNDELTDEESIRLDQEIEQVLEQAAHANRQTLRHFVSDRLSMAFLVPAARTSVFAATTCRRIATKCWDVTTRTWRQTLESIDQEELELEDEVALLDGEEGMDMESDFSVSVKTTISLEAKEEDKEVDADRSPDLLEFPAPRTATLTAMAPNCFADLRRFFGISESSFTKSLLESGPYISFQSNSKGAARPGLWFFFTRDGAYMIKTIKKDEVAALQRMLPKYYRFMQMFGQRSLLTKFCGMYQVSLQDHHDDDKERTHTFVVMNSVFPPEATKLLTERFDLKGSTLGRECSADERDTKGSSAVLKDLDLLREVAVAKVLPPPGRRDSIVGSSEPAYGLHIGAVAKAALLKQLRRDVQLLVACDAIDYSLLVGVAKEDMGIDAAVSLAMDQSLQWEAQLQGRRRSRWNVLSSALLPIQALLAPPFYFLGQSLRIAKKLLMWPEPYYGSGVCVVDAGPLSLIQGRRRGAPAAYYFGVIDFLQPYNTKKSLEYRLKNLVYPKDSFSCVPPRLYADRFLDFINEHVT